MGTRNLTDAEEKTLEAAYNYAKALDAMKSPTPAARKNYHFTLTNLAFAAADLIDDADPGVDRDGTNHSDAG